MEKASLIGSGILNAATLALGGSLAYKQLSEKQIEIIDKWVPYVEEEAAGGLVPYAEHGGTLPDFAVKPPASLLARFSSWWRQQERRSELELREELKDRATRRELELREEEKDRAMRRRLEEKKLEMQLEVERQQLLDKYLFTGSHKRWGNKYKDPLPTVRIKDWESRKTKILKAYLKVDVKEARVQYCRSKQVSYDVKELLKDGIEPGKSLYAVDESDKTVALKHYAAAGLFLLACLRSICEASGEDVPEMFVLVEEKCATSAGDRYLDTQVLINGEKRLIIGGEGKTLKRKSDLEDVSARKKKKEEMSAVVTDAKPKEVGILSSLLFRNSKIFFGEENKKRVDKEKSAEELKKATSNKTFKTANDAEFISSDEFAEGRGQVAEFHIHLKKQAKLQVGYVYNGPYFQVVRTDFDAVGDNIYRTSQFSRVTVSGNIVLGGVCKVDTEFQGFDMLLQQMFLSLVAAGIIDGGDVGDFGGQDKAEAEMVKGADALQVEDRLVEVQKVIRATPGRSYVFMARSSGGKAWLKVAPQNDPLHQVEREIAIRRYLCPMDTVSATETVISGGVLCGRRALVLEDGGTLVSMLDMQPQDVYEMSKQLYELLSHVYSAHGVCHNDVAARNICRSQDGRYTLIDWGMGSVTSGDIPPPEVIPDDDCSADCFFTGSAPGATSDFQSLIYTGLKLMRVSLPWSRSEDRDEVLELRKKFKEEWSSTPWSTYFYPPLIREWMQSC